MRQTVIVCGCPRSGTTALAMLLNHHPEACIGIERFSHLLLSGSPPGDLFTPARFADVRFGDTFHEGFRAEERALGLPGKAATARLIGDKVPKAYRHYGAIAEAFPGIRFLFIVRRPDAVAASYKRRATDPADRDWREGSVEDAISDWNEAVGATLYWRRRVPILPVSFEALFDRGEGLDGLAAFLGLDPAPLRTPLRHCIARGRQLAADRAPVLTTAERAAVMMDTAIDQFDMLVRQAA